jgi:electron transport complex protein RnfE
MMGFGLALVLSLLGGIRELIGKGTLLSGIDLALGPAAKHFVVTVIPDYHGFLLAILPPGAFIGLAMLIASKNWLDNRRSASDTHATPHPEMA